MSLDEAIAEWDQYKEAGKAMAASIAEYEEVEVKWDKRFLRIAREVSTWSKDPSTQVGAIAVKNRRILATGYNGFPNEIDDTEERLNDRETKHKYIVHAEQNMIYNATNNGVSLQGCTVYVWGLPNCSECTKGLIQVGAHEIICAYPVDLNPRWRDSYALSEELMREVGVLSYVYNTEEI